MPYYLISLTYDVGGGDTVRLDINNIEAKNQASALDRLPELLERIDKMQGNPQIDAIKASGPNPTPTKVDIKPVPAPPPVDPSRFLLQRSQKMKHGWVCTDRENGLVVTFREHRFNETRKATFLDGYPGDYLVTARVLREMGDWLTENHKEIVF